MSIVHDKKSPLINRHGKVAWFIPRTYRYILDSRAKSESDYRAKKTNVLQSYAKDEWRELDAKEEEIVRKALKDGIVTELIDLDKLIQQDLERERDRVAELEAKLAKYEAKEKAAKKAPPKEAAIGNEGGQAK